LKYIVGIVVKRSDLEHGNPAERPEVVAGGPGGVGAAGPFEKGASMKFGERLRELRLETCMTLKYLSQKLKVSAAYLSSIENGKAGPPSDKLVERITNYFQCEETELLRLAYYDRLPPVLQDICRKVLLQKPPAS
jgi:hypothetical protein